MQRRRFTGLVAVLSAALVLTGCSDDPASSGADGSKAKPFHLLLDDSSEQSIDLLVEPSSHYGGQTLDADGGKYRLKVISYGKHSSGEGLAIKMKLPRGVQSDPSVAVSFREEVSRSGYYTGNWEEGESAAVFTNLMNKPSAGETWVLWVRISASDLEHTPGLEFNVYFRF
ncbi:hypothetical protein AB0M47_42325 [Hamadaea sp. NPDC051192]|uniref:hypothetical protein n=1 Tax=Hamadaea sp. NPDC051192 TaxID=3154940 RepID=UPI003435A257